MAKKQQSYECPPKRFALPANLAALQGYAQLIIKSMHSEHTGRMAWSRTHKFKGKD